MKDDMRSKHTMFIKDSVVHSLATYIQTPFSVHDGFFWCPNAQNLVLVRKPMRRNRHQNLPPLAMH